MRSISILIPCYDNLCYEQVVTMKNMADAISGFSYEIVVADDGSNDAHVVSHNRKINNLENCRYVERKQNVGRAAIRNYLASLAQYDWLLFLDCEVYPSTESFLSNYIAIKADDGVVCGGVSIGGNADELAANLRYMYEKHEEHNHVSEKRNMRPYKSFRTTNFMIQRSAMIKNKFDEAITTYGYEDVLFGMRLEQNGISIMHIDNSVLMYRYEDNLRFIEKTEEAIRTLHSLKDRLEDYSPLLKARRLARKTGLYIIGCLCFRMTGKYMRQSLTSKHPKLRTFKAYKLLYLISL